MGNLERDRASSPVNPGDSATRQQACFEGPRNGPRWGAYHWPYKVAPGDERRLVPKASNLKPEAFFHQYFETYA